MHGFLKDIRFGVRSCARSPTFTLTIVLLLSLAIGVNVTVFAVVNAVLFKPLPVRDGDGLLRVFGHRTRAVPYANYETYRDANATLSDLALSVRVPVRLQAEGLDVVANLAAVSGNYFHTLGVPAALGRTIQPVDDERGAPGAIMLSDSLWRRHFGADPDALGQTVRIAADIFTIVGVAPPDFIGISFPFAEEAWVAWNSPLPLSVIGGDMVGRARDEVALTEVQADLSRLAAQIPDTLPFGQPGTFSTATVYPLRFLGTMEQRQITVVAGILVTLSGSRPVRHGREHRHPDVGATDGTPGRDGDSPGRGRVAGPAVSPNRHGGSGHFLPRRCWGNRFRLRRNHRIRESAVAVVPASCRGIGPWLRLAGGSLYGQPVRRRDARILAIAGASTAVDTERNQHCGRRVSGIVCSMAPRRGHLLAIGSGDIARRHGDNDDSRYCAFSVPGPRFRY